MSDPFVAEIRIFPFNFAPRFWAFCDGQILALSQNTALFSLLGTFYGGNGQTNFALPNLQGKAALHPGQGPGLSQRNLGEVGGSTTVTLLQSQIPNHTHTLKSIGTEIGDTNIPTDNGLARSSGGSFYNTSVASPVAMNASALAVAGSDQPHNNMQPYLTLNFCIALAGVYPPRN
ncbi:MAG: tail fiber protein [Bacteroidota bacterium]